MKLILWEASDEKAQAVVQDLTASQLDDAEGYRLKAMELMKQNGALSILASMSKSKALNLFSPEQKYSYNMFEEAMNYKNFVIKRRDSKYISSALILYAIYYIAIFFSCRVGQRAFALFPLIKPYVRFSLIRLSDILLSTALCHAAISCKPFSCNRVLVPYSPFSFRVC